METSNDKTSKNIWKNKITYIFNIKNVNVIVRKIDYKFLIGTIIASLGLYFAYMKLKPEEGILNATISKCTFFVPSDYKNPPQIQFEIILLNNFKYNLSVRPTKGFCIYKKTDQQLNYYTNSSKMVFLNVGETKTLTYLSDFDDNCDYNQINKDLITYNVRKILNDFNIGILLSTGQKYILPVLINDETDIFYASKDTTSDIPNKEIQFMVIMLPPDRFGQTIEITNKDFEKNEWLVE